MYSTACRHTNRLALTTLVVGLTAVTLPAAGVDHPPSRPNILLICIDDLRVELGCYGSQHILSPHIDRFARSGMLFERAYCQQAVCTASRASFFTGLRPESVGVLLWSHKFRDSSPDVVTLPQLLRQHGYFTETMGKTLAPYDPASWDRRTEPRWGRNFKASASRKYADEATIDRIEQKHVDATAAGLKGIPLSRATRGPAWESSDVDDEAYHDGKLATLAVRSLQQLAETDQPFLLAVGFRKPHFPFAAPQRYWEKYSTAQLPPLTNPFHPCKAPWFALGSSAEFRGYADTPDGQVPDEMARTLRHGYAACISYLDAQVGRVLDAVWELQLQENTIVVLWSDHGFKLGEHAAWGKSTNVELDNHVPLIVRVPGVTTPDSRCSRFVELVDNRYLLEMFDNIWNRGIAFRLRRRRFPVKGRARRRVVSARRPIHGAPVRVAAGPGSPSPAGPPRTTTRLRPPSLAS